MSSDTTNGSQNKTSKNVLDMAVGLARSGLQKLKLTKGSSTQDEPGSSVQSRASKSELPGSTSSSLKSRAAKYEQPHCPVNVRENKDQPNKVYTKTQDQKGYIAILIWTHEPHESDTDMANVQQFFKNELQWDTELHLNLTKQGLDDCISDLQSRFSKEDFAAKYYCLGIAIIGHGDEGKIQVSTGDLYPIEDLVDSFKNDRITTLVGKYILFKGIPRFFLIEACRGHSEQPVVQSRGLSDTPRERLPLPVDSDIHISYATTKGFVSHFSPEKGSWFTIAAMDEFTSNYKDHHMEDMLISVRQNVAAVRIENIGQMPCSWSTFTKKFYLASAAMKIK